MVIETFLTFTTVLPIMTQSTSLADHVIESPHDKL